MIGFNLPPGCNVSDIPDNHSEDERAEALYNAVYKPVAELFGSDLADSDLGEKLCSTIVELIEKSYQEGYSEGAAEAKQSFQEERRRIRERTYKQGEDAGRSRMLNKPGFGDMGG